MNISDFTHQKKYRLYEIKRDGIEVYIPESQMSDEVAAFAEELIQAYPQKIPAIAEYLSSAVDMDENAKEELTKALLNPRIAIDRQNGDKLNFGNKALDKRYFG